MPLFVRFRDETLREFPHAKGRRLLFDSIRRMLSQQVYDVIDATRARIAEHMPLNADEARQCPPLVRFSPGMREASTQLKRFLFKELPFDTLKDFVPVASFAQITFVLVVSPKSPHNSIADLVAHLKKKGDNLYGYTNQTAQLSTELFKQMTGAPAKPLPYKTAPDAMKEITESAIMDDPQRAFSTLDLLHGMGFRLSIDDFGTGYSSLAYLKRLPVQQLKIDQSFVRDMLDDPDDLAILEGVLGLSRAFHREVIGRAAAAVREAQHDGQADPRRPVQGPPDGPDGGSLPACRPDASQGRQRARQAARRLPAVPARRLRPDARQRGHHGPSRHRQFGARGHAGVGHSSSTRDHWRLSPDAYAGRLCENHSG